MLRKETSMHDGQTMTKTTMEISSPIFFDQKDGFDESFGGFKMHTKGICSRLMGKLGFDGKGPNYSIKL